MKYFTLLREKDPATWKRIVEGVPLEPCSQYVTYDRGEATVHQFLDVYIPFGELLPEVAQAWIQAVLQDAIRGRGWEFRLEIIENGDYGAFIGRPVAEAAMQYGEYSYADSPAEALLAAYLEAIIG